MKKSRFSIPMITICSVLSCSLLSSHIFAENVGVTWFGKSGMAKRVMTGVEERLGEVAPDIQLEYKDTQPSLEELGNRIKEFEGNKDAIIVMRSNGAKFLAKNPSSLPTFIGATNDPQTLGTVKNPDAPEGTITGVTYALPVDVQFETFQAILPEMQSLLLLTEKGHPSGPIEAAKTKGITEELGLTYNHLEVENLDQLLETVKANVGQYDAMIMGTQAVLIDNAKVLVETAGATPVLAFSSKPVKDGALGGFVADDHKLGRMLADSLVDVLKNGKKIAEVSCCQSCHA